MLVKDLLRKYPQWSHDCIAVVGNISSKNVQEPKAKAALIWMLGEYSQDMHDAPYILESLIENWDEEHSDEVTKMLLYCSFFFAMPRPFALLTLLVCAFYFLIGDMISVSKAVTLVMKIRLYETKSASLVSLGSLGQFNIAWIFKYVVARYYRLTCS